jgi:DnaJ homologue, subfamily C, member 28, conserved domain
MTERKPLGMSYTSWIDQQISEAAERGAFEGLPGAGKPLPKRSEEDAAQAWIRDYAQREGVPPDDLLPTPLKLRKESAGLAGAVAVLASEAEVREAVKELNQRIMQWRRLPLGPPVFVPLVDEEQTVATWLASRSEPEVSQSPAGPAAKPPRSRWRRRLRPG